MSHDANATELSSSPADKAAILLKQRDRLQRWVDSEDFWQAQPFENRFYFGAGTTDYVSRDALRTFLTNVLPAASVARRLRGCVTIPSCGDPDCNTCDLVSIPTAR